MNTITDRESIYDALNEEDKEMATFFCRVCAEGYYTYFEESDLARKGKPDYEEILEGAKEEIFNIYNLLGSPVYEFKDKEITVQIDGTPNTSNFAFTYLNRKTGKEYFILRLRACSLR